MFIEKPVDSILKKSWWSNGKIQFPTKIVYAVHSKLIQIIDWNFC